MRYCNFFFKGDTEYLAFSVNGTEVEPNDLIDAQEGERMNISCLASKAVPKPRLVINSGLRDVTNEFQEVKKAYEQFT